MIHWNTTSCTCAQLNRSSDLFCYIQCCWQINKIFSVLVFCQTKRRERYLYLIAQTIYRYRAITAIRNKLWNRLNFIFIMNFVFHTLSGNHKRLWKLQKETITFSNTSIQVYISQTGVLPLTEHLFRQTLYQQNSQQSIHCEWGAYLHVPLSHTKKKWNEVKKHQSLFIS